MVVLPSGQQRTPRVADRDPGQVCCGLCGLGTRRARAPKESVSVGFFCGRMQGTPERGYNEIGHEIQYDSDPILISILCFEYFGETSNMCFPTFSSSVQLCLDWLWHAVTSKRHTWVAQDKDPHRRLLGKAGQRSQPSKEIWKL